jgi:hypothetical protein
MQSPVGRDLKGIRSALIVVPLRYLLSGTKATVEFTEIPTANVQNVNEEH